MPVRPVMLQALARAHCWKRMLEEVHYSSISEIAAAERINRGYLLQLMPLAPDIVEAILDRRHAAELGLPKLMRSSPVDWPGQRAAFADAAHREPPTGALNRG
jgi:hypothetical protein